MIPALLPVNDEEKMKECTPPQQKSEVAGALTFEEQAAVAHIPKPPCA